MDTKTVAAKVSGACGFCGAVRVIPAHKANVIAPRPVATCPHTSDR